MEVPSWLMKPTENNKEHIKLLAMIEHVQKAAERRGVDPFLNNQINRLNKSFWEHAENTVGLEENPVVEVLEKDRKKTLIIGLFLAAGILIPYGLLTKTNLLHPRPRYCWELVSAEEEKTTKVCLLAVNRAYSPNNGDVSLAMTIGEGGSKSTLIDVDFWIADQIGGKEVDYEGEYNINRTRVYNNGILISDDKTAWSSWVRPMIPPDSVIPVWKEIKEKQRELNYEHPLAETKIVQFVENAGAIVAGLSSVLFTIWRFYTRK